MVFMFSYEWVGRGEGPLYMNIEGKKRKKTFIINAEIIEIMFKHKQIFENVQKQHRF